MKLNDRVALLLISLLALVANFLHAASFGFYDDDWYYMAPPWDTSAQRWFSDRFQTMRSFYLGRPLQELCLGIFGFVGAALHSILADYFIAAALFVITAVLMYRVLRIRYSIFFATLAASLFVISPLTTVRQHLDATLWSGPGLICLFLGILAYHRRRTVLSFVLAAATLLIYEPMFLVFLGAPLFRKGKRSRKKIALHALAWLAILIAYAWVRRHFSEPRLASAMGGSGLQTIWSIARFDGLFVFGTLVAYVYGAYVALAEHPLEGSIFGALFALVLLGVLRSRAAEISLRRLPPRWWLWRAILPGLVLTALAYGFTYFSMAGIFTYPVTGRDTRFSIAAQIGSSIFAVGVFGLALALVNGRASNRRWLTGAVQGAGIAFYALFVVYSFVIQEDYVRQWDLDKKLLAGIVAATPDATADTLIILQEQPIVPFLVSGKHGPAISNQSHALQFSLRRLFAHGAAPEIFEVFGDPWKNYLHAGNDGTLRWTLRDFQGGWARDTEAPVGPIILLLEKLDGSIARMNAPLMIDGRQVNLILDQASNARESNWNRRTRSPLVEFVLP